MKAWYSIQNKESSVNISLHDEIGLYGISAKEFISEINSLTGIKSINLSIHSPGGSMIDGIAMYNALKNHPAKVYASVEGIAASAASLVLMAGDVVTMPEDSYLMIHNPWGVTVGDAEEMRDYADLLDKFKDTAINIYSKKAGIAPEIIFNLMTDETWLNANEALDFGFIDTITNAIGVAAKANIFEKHFKAMPVKQENKIDGIANIKDFEKYLRDSGFSRSQSTQLASKAKVIFQSESEENQLEPDYSTIEAALMRLKMSVTS